MVFTMAPCAALPDLRLGCSANLLAMLEIPLTETRLPGRLTDVFAPESRAMMQAALDAGCSTLYSEDMQTGMRFGGARRSNGRPA